MNRSRVAAICIGLVALVVSIAPSSALAQRGASVSRQAAAPLFSFPTNGTSYPSNGPYMFQLQPVSGAKGYLWSFVQNGVVVYQNLAWDGHLSPSNYTVSTNSKAHNLVHPGDLHVWVRALMKNGQWSATGAVLVRIQGKGEPSPKPTSGPSHPAPGTVLYQADTAGGLNKWTGSSDWKHLDGMLVNDGSAMPTQNNNLSWIRAPYSPSTADYAVEVQLQFVKLIGTLCAYPPGFGIVVRAHDQTGYWVGDQQYFNDCSGKVARIVKSTGPGPGNTTNLAETTHAPDTDWHTYRVEVQANNIRLLVDGSVVIQTVDNSYLSAGQVGIWCSGMQINVRSFKVIAL